MAVIQFGGQLVFVDVRQAKAVRILGPQIDIAFLIGIIIQLELKWVQVLIGRAVNPAAIGQTPLAFRIFIESHRRAREKIGVMPLVPGFARFIDRAVAVQPIRIPGAIRVFNTDSCLEQNTFF